MSKEKEMLLIDHTSFHVKEAYKTTRTNIGFSLVGEGCKKIIISSSEPSEGKSTTCINLALTFVQTGVRVLVIDADLRRPTIHRKLELSNESGLSHLISGFCDKEDAIQKTKYDGLDVITAGHIPPNPVELIASRQMEDLLESLEAHYDYIFIDTPPLNRVTDVVVLSKYVSGTILVVREGVTQHGELQEALSKLAFAKAKVLGIILHNVKHEKKKRKKRDKKYDADYYAYGYESSGSR